MLKALRPGMASLMLVAALSVALYGYRLGERSFRDPDEGRYAEIAREMIATKDWVQPKLYGVDYLRKPPLFYWAVATAFKAFGYTERAARAVPAGFAFAGVLMLFLFARRYLGERAALFASLMLATNAWYLGIGRYLIIDSLFTFFVTASLFAFYAAQKDARRDLLYYLIFYASMGLACLAKGPIGAALPAAAILVYALFTRQVLAVLKDLRPLLGLAVLAAVLLPWTLRIEILSPGTLGRFIGHEYLSRFTSASFEHQEPFFFYLMWLPVVLLPWSLVPEPLFRAFDIRRARAAGDDLKIFAFSSAAAMLALYSLSSSKLLTYVLPCLPFLCLLLGQAWSEWQGKPMQERLRRVCMGLFALLFTAGAIALWKANVFFAKPLNNFGPEVFNQLKLLPVAAMVFAAAALRALAGRSQRRLFIGLILTMITASALMVRPMEAMNAFYSTRAFAEELKPRLTAADRVFIYGTPGAFYDLRFYLGHPVTLVGLSGELELADPKRQSPGAWVTQEEFSRMLHSGERFYCLTRKSDYLNLPEAVRQKLHLLKFEERKVLFRSGPA